MCTLCSLREQEAEAEGVVYALELDTAIDADHKQKCVCVLDVQQDLLCQTAVFTEGDSCASLKIRIHGSGSIWAFFYTHKTSSKSHNLMCKFKNNGSQNCLTVNFRLAPVTINNEKDSHLPF